MTPFAEYLATASRALAEVGVQSPDVDAELLLGHVLGLSRGEVQAKSIQGSTLSDDEEAAVAVLVARRVNREPLQHITGLAPFRSIELRVGPGVFVPRPETEQVAQYAIDALLAVPASVPIAVDLGTGSGAIALAMATEVPHARIYAIEKSPEAFSWAAKNRQAVGAANATIVLGDLASAFPELDGTADVVISNPPYIPTDAIPRDLEVRLYDPEIALYGGEDGLDVVRQVSLVAMRLLHRGGTVVIEHGELQGVAIADLLRADGWSAVSTHRDLLGRDRATTALRP